MLEASSAEVQDEPLPAFFHLEGFEPHLSLTYEDHFHSKYVVWEKGGREAAFDVGQKARLCLLLLESVFDHSNERNKHYYGTRYGSIELPG